MGKPGFPIPQPLVGAAGVSTGGSMGKPGFSIFSPQETFDTPARLVYSNIKNGAVAQWIEQPPSKRPVVRSIRTSPATLKRLCPPARSLFASEGL